MNSVWSAIFKLVGQTWDESVIPSLCEYIKVPNGSPDFDPEWKTNGLMMKALQVQLEWLAAQPVNGLTYEVIEEPNRTPFLLIEIAGTQPTVTTCFMYAHMDKQPPLDLSLWAEGLAPYTPVLKDGKLYGRGGADDGYGLYAAITSIAVLQKHNIPHARICIAIEAAEESASDDLEFYITKCLDRLGKIDFVICLDGGALTYDALWLTTSLRGITEGFLKVKQSLEPMHSGIAGGVVPDAFRIARHLLNRVEDSLTGDILLPELKTVIPAATLEKLRALGELGESLEEAYPMQPGVQLEVNGNVEIALRNFWEPSLTVVGADLPPVETAGNVIRDQCTLKLSIRIPPGVHPPAATAAVKKALEANPPYNALVSFTPFDQGAPGWKAPDLEPWLSEALTSGSQEAFKKDFGFLGDGASIPFMGMLGELFPESQFLVTGVLGPKSNAHGPNEFLDIETGKKLTYCTARAVAAHFVQAPKA